MPVIIQFLIPILYLCGAALFVSSIFKIRFEQALPLAIISSVIITYIFGFIDLRIGFIVSVVISVTSLPLAVFSSRKTDGFNVRKYFFDQYFFAFLLVYIFLFLLNAGKCFDRWDEYSHWGLMTKEMYRLNKYYFVNESVLVAHPEYPPFSQIWQYIWCKLIGTFKESSLYNAKLTLCLSVMMSALSGVMQSKTITKGAVRDNKIQSGLRLILPVIIITVMSIIIAAVPRLEDGSVYRTIYAEGAMVILTVYTIICAAFPDNNRVYDLVSYSLTMAALSLVKQIGPLFAVISLFFLSIRAVNGRIRLKHNDGRTEDISLEQTKHDRYKLVTGSLAVFLPWFIWKCVTKVYTTAGQFDSGRFSVSKLLEIIKGNGSPAQNRVVIDFLHALYSEKLIWIPGINYLSMAVILAFLLVILRRRDLMVTMLVSVIGYAIVMQITYLFGFSEEEMAGLACFPRYMNSMIGMWAITVILLVIHAVNTTTDSRLPYLILCVILLVVIGIDGIRYELMPGIFTSNDEGLFASDAERIDKYTSPGSRVYVVDTEGNDASTNVIRFLSNGRYISDAYVAPNPEQYEEAADYMKEFDYVYLDNIDEEYISTYGDLYEDRESLSRQQLYSVTIKEDNMTLDWIEME